MREARTAYRHDQVHHRIISYTIVYDTQKKQESNKKGGKGPLENLEFVEIEHLL